MCHWQRVTVQLNIKLPNTSCSHPETQISVRLLVKRSSYAQSPRSWAHAYASSCCRHLPGAGWTHSERLHSCNWYNSSVLGTENKRWNKRKLIRTLYSCFQHCPQIFYRDHEKGTLHAVKGCLPSHQRETGLSWEKQLSLRRRCFINWATLLRAELLTTLRWGLPVHEPHVSRSIKHLYQVKLSEFSLDRSSSHSKLIAFLCTLRGEMCVCVGGVC